MDTDKNKTKSSNKILLKALLTIIIIVILIIVYDLIGSIKVKGDYNIFGKKADNYRLFFKNNGDFDSKVNKPDDTATNNNTGLKAEDNKTEDKKLTEAEKRKEYEKTLYTYFQGPKALKEKLPYSGVWGDTFIDGKKFGAFGCGLCCTANVYASFSGYKATPLDMYEFSKKSTAYYGGGAIGWGDLKRSLIKSGFKCSIHRKDKRYSDFKKRIMSSKCAIVLVSSYNSTEYWKNTPGHYVTIYSYDKIKNKVFLADSGDPKHNRHWVDLTTIYKSLKTVSQWQYIAVRSYDESRDTFKNTKETGKWNKPDYLK